VPLVELGLRRRALPNQVDNPPLIDLGEPSARLAGLERGDLRPQGGELPAPGLLGLLPPVVRPPCPGGLRSGLRPGLGYVRPPPARRRPRTARGRASPGAARPRPGRPGRPLPR